MLWELFGRWYFTDPTDKSVCKAWRGLSVELKQIPPLHRLSLASNQIPTDWVKLWIQFSFPCQHPTFAIKQRREPQHRTNLTATFCQKFSPVAVDLEEKRKNKKRKAQRGKVNCTFPFTWMYSVCFRLCRCTATFAKYLLFSKYFVKNILLNILLNIYF